MAGIDLAAVMDALAAAVQTKLASGRTAYAWPVEAVVPGDAVVGYPEPFDLTMTFRRGADRATLPVFVFCGLWQDETTRDAVADWITGSGAVVEAIEGYSTGAWSSVAVTRAAIERFDPVGGNSQVAIRFDCDVLS